MIVKRFFFFSILIVLALPALGSGPARPDPELRRLLMDAVAQTSVFQDPYYAEVWLLDMSTRLQRYVPDAYTRIELLKAVHEEANRARISPELVLSVIHVESLFDPWAISRAGAQGLMQIMPFWLRELKLKDQSLFDMRTNLRLGCTILRFYMDREKNLTRALARYNGSPGSFQYPQKVFKVMDNRWKRR